LLYAAIRGETLYVAVQDAGEGNNHLIFIADDTGSLQSANWPKPGEAMTWITFLADEDGNGLHGWFDQNGDRLQRDSHGYRSMTPGEGDTTRGLAVLEGTVDLMSHFGGTPDRLFIAAAPCNSPEGIRLIAGSQVPAGDDDRDLERYRRSPRPE
jgi:hypothetical protein